MKLLELKSDNFFPRFRAAEILNVELLSVNSHRFAEFLWRSIGDGAPQDRSDWNASTWQSHLANPGHYFYTASVDADPVGCFELVRASSLMLVKPTLVTISGLGLIPEFQADGLGPVLLTKAVEKALALGTTTVNVSVSAQLTPAMLSICKQQGFTLVS